MNRNPLVIVPILILAACAGTAPSQGPRASAELQPASGSQVRGRVNFIQSGDRVHVVGDITGHTPGRKGFHIHERGDCSAPDAMSAAGHYNPTHMKHGAPGTGHAGDLGNIVFDASGKAHVDLMASGIAVSRTAPNGIVGRALIVHMQEDDLKTDPTGNAGGRAACGVIREG